MVLVDLNLNTVIFQPNILLPISRFLLVAFFLTTSSSHSLPFTFPEHHHRRNSVHIHLYRFNYRQRYALKSNLPQQHSYLTPSLSEPSTDTILSPQEIDRRLQQDILRRQRLERRNLAMSSETEDTGLPAEPPVPVPVDPALTTLLTNANTNNEQLNATLQVLLTHFSAPSVPVHDLFASNQPFNLAHQSGLAAYEQACAPLKSKWNGGPSDYPTFLIELRDCARDCKWDASGTTGIVNIPQHGRAINVLHNHHGLREASVLDAYAAGTEPRAVQNSKSMYKCIKSSLTGDALTSIFNTPGNAPTHDDGIELFFKCTKLSTISSVRLANKAIADLNTYCPSTRAFELPMVFEDIAKHFILVSASRSLSDSDKIPHALAIIKKIQQPSTFARFVERKEDEYDAGTLMNYQVFSQDVLLQYQKIKDTDAEHKFRGSLSTIQEDIIAMMAKAKTDSAKLSSRPVRRQTNPSGPPSVVAANGKPPPFLTYTKTSNRSDAQPHKVGDTRTWNNETWYYCDAPHRDNHHWHKHAIPACVTRKKWLERDGNEQSTSTPTANVGEAIDSSSTVTTSDKSTLTSASIDSKDATALLCAALTARPDCAIAVQQCARFCNNPTRDHEEAVKRICRYLLRTRHRGIVLRPDRNRGLECMVDADWAGSWRDRSSNDPLSAHSRTGYIIMYAGCPIAWKSSLQPLIALSTTEAEYIALSTALREVIAVMHLVEELRDRQFNLNLTTPKVTCRTFEDNKSCIEIATNHKTRARTKHLSVRLHHFRSHVVNKTITIEHISTTNQLGDAFTKPLALQQFRYLRDIFMGWVSPHSANDIENESPNIHHIRPKENPLDTLTRKHSHRQSIRI